MVYDVIVLGAGASGMMAAIWAARNKQKVCVIEILPKAGKKILATGNGKCNLTNLIMEEDCFRSDSLEGDSKIMDVINRFDNNAVIDFFNNLGLLTRTRDSYVYPYSEQASSVLDALRLEVQNSGAKLLTDARAKSIEYNNELFNINIMHDNMMSLIQGKTMIIATGSTAGITGYDCNQTYSFAKKYGHTLIEPMPALVPLICKENFFKGISGVRAKGNIALFINGKFIAKDQGEIQFTDTGISGIPVFQLSRYAVKGIKNKESVTAVMDLMPEYSRTQIMDTINKIIKNNHLRKDSPDYTLQLADVLTGLVNKKLMNLFIKLSNGDASKIAQMIKEFKVTIVDNKKSEFAQVMQGGIRMDEVNLDTMESIKLPGLFFCGEILDVDGICGGYNLTWAWSSGYTAGLGASHFNNK